MSEVQHKRKGVLVSVKNVVFAFQQEDAFDDAVYVPEIHHAPGLIEVALTANASDDSLAADDNPSWEVLAALDSIDASIIVASIDDVLEAKLRGQEIDGNGARLIGSNDNPPWAAMGFEARGTNGSKDYVWLYKGKFKPSDQTFHTREKGSVNWQTPTLKATFTPRDHDGRIMVSLNNKQPGAAAALATFFDKPYEPVASVPPTESETPPPEPEEP